MRIALLPRLAALAALLALASCQRERLTPDEHAARTAVARYNELLVQAFRSGRAELLRDIADPEEVDRIDGIVGSLARQGSFMDARQTESRILKTFVNEKPDGVSLVETVERWEYQHRALARRDQATPSKAARYRIAYELVRKDGKFVVHRLVEHELPPGESP